jgi:GDP-L-fucose synthase
VKSSFSILIKDIINKIIEISNKEIKVKWDSSKPNGDLKRLMDTTKQIKYDILPEISFDKALKNVYEFYSNTTK